MTGPRSWIDQGAWEPTNGPALARLLADTYPRRAEIERLLGDVGVRLGRMLDVATGDAQWRHLTFSLWQNGQLRRLLDAAVGEYPALGPGIAALEVVASGSAAGTGAGPGLRRFGTDLRLSLSRFLDDNGLVGGRDRELTALDAFVAAANPQYLVLTGAAGMGKTALLAEWIRRLDARPDVDVIYYFISRQYGTAGYPELLVTLIAQAMALAGSLEEPPPASTDLPTLEARWHELLLPSPFPRRPLVVVIDGADEAEAAGWSLARLRFPTGRSGTVHLAPDLHLVVSARTMTGHAWPQLLGLDGAREMPLTGLTDEGVAQVLAVADVPAWVREPGPRAVLLDRTAGDPFYLRFLVDALVQKKITSPAGLTAAPGGLAEYLQELWGDARGSAEDQARLTVLGYLSVTVGPITAEELSEIDPDGGPTMAQIDRVLAEIGRVVVGDPATTGIALATWRLRDIVGAKLFRRRERAGFHARLLAWCDRWREHRYRYAVTRGATHRLESAAGPEDLADVANLLADNEYQKLRVQELGDAAGLFGDLDRLLAELLHQPRAPAAGLAGVALEVGQARELWSRPEAVFSLAAAGSVDDARHRLDLLGPQPWPPWGPVARLVLAWVLAGVRPDAARELLDAAGSPTSSTMPDSVITGRARHALGDGQEPPLRTWFLPDGLPSSDRSAAAMAIERVGGAPASREQLHHLEYGDLFPVSSYTQDNEAGTYLAESDAPALVAYARDQPGEGDGWLATYIELQAANPYALYRNRALFSVLALVCCLPDAGQALRHAIHVTEAAFAPSPVRFAEFARLAALAATGDRSRVSTMRSEATARASAVTGWREHGDQWGHHVRRLAAHAEIAAAVLGDAATAGALLERVLAIPNGYAGYRAPAHLALAETRSVLGDVPGRQAALDEALRSAHNIQEPSFCAVMTARVRTLTEWWQEPPVRGLAEFVAAFVADPDGASFSPRHRVGEPFERRDRQDHLPIEIVTNARTMDDMAYVLGVSVAGLRRLNPEPAASTVVLPDPEFAPLVASWLAARIASARLAPPERMRLTAPLIPIAAGEATSLDLVLGRWVCALAAAGADLSGLPQVLAQRDTVEPAGGREAGVA